MAFITRKARKCFSSAKMFGTSRSRSVIDDQDRKQAQPIDPYFVLMQLPGEQASNEFVLILPFTPAGRNNMIGWMAGRSDGDNYGKLLIYNFPKSRLIDGPLQIEARIDQNSAALFSVYALEPTGLACAARPPAGHSDRPLASLC